MGFWIGYVLTVILPYSPTPPAASAPPTPIFVMPVMRLLLILIVLLGLGVFAWQNWLPVMPVVFLGAKTQALPLAIWLLGAIASGFITSGILQLLNYLSSTPLQARIRELEAAPSPSSSPRTKRAEPESTSTQASDADTNDDDVFDWEDEQPKSDSRTSEDWDDEQSQAGSQTSEDWEDEEPIVQPKTQNSVRNSNTYEVRQEPTSTSRSGSVYSYSYRNPSNSSVGRTEAVYDADYRVITPPYRPPVDNTNDWESQAGNDEDWGFEDDDEFEDEYRRNL